jgi:hypothetical protein
MQEKTQMAEHPSDEHPIEVTPLEARQGTGPRDNFNVLIASLLLAAVAGTAILAYFLA